MTHDETKELLRQIRRDVKAMASSAREGYTALLVSELPAKIQDVVIRCKNIEKKFKESEISS